MVLTIYGNHENMNVLARLYNVKTRTYLPILMEDGKVYEFEGLRIAGINGIIARKRRTGKGVPRRMPEEYLEAAMKLRGKSIDVLLIHETPFLPQLSPFMRDDYKSRTALEAVKVVRSRLVVNGHMHPEGYKTYTFPWGARYVYGDSSQQNRHYLVLRHENSSIEVEVWRDHRMIEVIDVP